MNFRHLLLSLFIFPLYMFGHITGTYHVEGFDATINEHYEGTLEITENNDVYNLVWTYDGITPYIGTGVRSGNSLSIVFNEIDTTPFGTQLYKICGNTLKGPWILFGDTRISFERAEKN